MPARSSPTRVITWPDRTRVEAALREWAGVLAAERPEVLRVGYFGSYARDDWGVGSDLDVILVVSHSDRPFIERAVDYPASRLPVPADLLIYTRDEFDELLRRGDRFSRMIARETVWVLVRDENGGAGREGKPK